MALTAKAIDAAQPGEKARKIFDGNGLYVEIRPNGSKLWMQKYRFGGREKRLSFGPYPEVTLREARLRSEEARRLIRDGVDPSLHRQAQRRSMADEGGAFEVVAREWFAKWKEDKAESHHSRVLRALERDVFPKVGRQPIAELEPVEILTVLRAVEKRGAVDTAHRIKNIISMVFRYGVATGRVERDHTADMRGALAATKPGHYASIIDPAAFGALLRAMDGYSGHSITAWGLRLAPLVSVRPGELRKAEWEEIDLDTATWTIPGSKMKLGKDHIVPLSRQAVAVLEEARSLTGRGRYVFPSLRSASRPMSDNTLNAALRRLGYAADQMTCHGFRASFRTIGDEVLGFRPDFLEHQLAHAVKDPNGRAYNRTAFLPERRVMMQAWADWCEEAKAKAPVNL